MTWVPHGVLLNPAVLRAKLAPRRSHFPNVFLSVEGCLAVFCLVCPNVSILKEGEEIHDQCAFM